MGATRQTATMRLQQRTSAASCRAPLERTFEDMPSPSPVPLPVLIRPTGNRHSRLNVRARSFLDRTAASS